MVFAMFVSIVATAALICAELRPVRLTAALLLNVACRALARLAMPLGATTAVLVGNVDEC